MVIIKFHLLKFLSQIKKAESMRLDNFHSIMLSLLFPRECENSERRGTLEVPYCSSNSSRNIHEARHSIYSTERRNPWALCHTTK